MNATDIPALSVVVPLYNEEDNIGELSRRLQEAGASMEAPAEVILVNDGSTDRTAATIDALARENNALTAVHLSRNFGHQAAITAGLKLARGNAVAIIDGDLQDPPELLKPMLKKLNEGFDVVYGVRASRQGTRTLRTCYTLYYKLLRKLSNLDIPANSGDFAVVSRRALDTINAMPERRRFIRGLRAYAGFKQTPFPYERPARVAGTSKYTLRKLFKLAGDGIFSFSETPLHVSLITGAIVAALALAYGGYSVAWRFFAQNPPPGWAALAAGVYFLGGVQLVALGILGLYVARIHQEVKQRPDYVIDRIVRHADIKPATPD